MVSANMPTIKTDTPRLVQHSGYTAIKIPNLASIVARATGNSGDERAATAGEGEGAMEGEGDAANNSNGGGDGSQSLAVDDHRIAFGHVYLKRQRGHNRASTDASLRRMLPAIDPLTGLPFKGLLTPTDLAVRARVTTYLRSFRVFMFDIEATGLNASTDEIVEIGFYDPQSQRSLSTLVRPTETTIPNRVTRIHQINQAMVRSAPTMLELMPRIVQFLNLRFEPTPAGVAACERLGLDPHTYVRREEEFGSESEEVKVLVSHSTFSLDEPMMRKAFRLVPELDTSLVVFADTVPMFRYFKRRVRNNNVDKSQMTSLRMSDLASAFGLAGAGAGGEGGAPPKVASALISSSASATGDSNNGGGSSSSTDSSSSPDAAAGGGGGLRLHRAIDDSILLWRLLVSALSLDKHDSPTEAFMAYLCDCIVHFPSEHPFLNQEKGERKGITVNLPGVAGDYLSPSQVEKLSLRPRLSNEALRLLSKKGSLVARLLLEKSALERHAQRFMQYTDSGSLVVVHPDGCVRQEIDVAATATSRSTSSSPSCQNIPKGDDDSLVRSVYVSRFGADGRCVEVDYAQLEVGVLAALSGDVALLRELNDGVDFHCKRAAFFEHARRHVAMSEYRQRQTAAIVAGSSLGTVFVDPSSASASSPSSSSPNSASASSAGPPAPLRTIDQLYAEISEGVRNGDPRYVAMRKQAKVVSFQRMYGGGVHLIHRTTGIPLPILRDAIEAEERQYPQLKAFYGLVRRSCLRVDNPGLPTHFTFEMPTGFRVSFDPADVKRCLPPLKNYPVQGYSAELVQMMLGHLFRHFASTGAAVADADASSANDGNGMSDLSRTCAGPNYGGKAFIVNFVHDSVWLDCHKSVVEAVTRDTVALLSSLPRRLPSLMAGVSVPLEMPVVAQGGLTFGAMTETMRTTHVPHEVLSYGPAMAAVIADGGVALRRERAEARAAAASEAAKASKVFGGCGVELSPKLAAAGAAAVAGSDVEAIAVVGGNLIGRIKKKGGKKTGAASSATADDKKADEEIVVTPIATMTVAERRKHRAQLKASLRRLAPVMDFLPDGVSPRKYGMSSSAAAPASDPNNAFLLDDEEMAQLEEEIAEGADLE